jgi:hypothetical protein
VEHLGILAALEQRDEVRTAERMRVHLEGCAARCCGGSRERPRSRGRSAHEKEVWPGERTVPEAPAGRQPRGVDPRK